MSQPLQSSFGRIDTTRFSAAPLAVAYVLFPMMATLSHHLGFNFNRNWIDLAWGGLAVGAIICLLVKLNQGKLHLRGGHVFLAAGIGSMVFGLIVFLKFSLPFSWDHVSFIPYLMEIKPIFYLLVTVLWVLAIGPVLAPAFIRYGSYLGAIISLDLMLDSLRAGKVVRPLGSGEINYDACLLLIALCVSLAVKSRKVPVLLIYAGLLATFSRTALLSAALILLIFSRVSLHRKLILSGVAFAFVLLSFSLRGLDMNNVESMDRFWMWQSGLELLLGHPGLALIGFPVGAALDVNVPTAVEWLWNFQQEGWGLSGVFPFNYHAFWLRFTITWGILVSMLFMVVLFGTALRRRNSILTRSIAVLILVEGVTMGLFYLSNVAIPLILVIYLGSTLRMPSLGAASRAVRPA